MIDDELARYGTLALEVGDRAATLTWYENDGASLWWGATTKEEHMDKRPVKKQDADEGKVVPMGKPGRRQGRLFPDSIKFDEKRFALIGSVRGDLTEALEKNDTVQIVITAHQKRVGIEWMEDERVVLTSYLQVDYSKVLTGDDLIELPAEPTVDDDPHGGEE